MSCACQRYHIRRCDYDEDDDDDDAFVCRSAYTSEYNAVQYAVTDDADRACDQHGVIGADDDCFYDGHSVNDDRLNDCIADDNVNDDANNYYCSQRDQNNQPGDNDRSTAIRSP